MKKWGDFAKLLGEGLLIPILVLLLWLLLLEGSLDTILQHFNIAVTMAFGSFIAGATPLGGGAVAYPILTKLLQIDPLTTKKFCLAIQSIGMGTASAVIIIQKINVRWLYILWGSLASIPANLLTISLTNEVVFSTVFLKLFFSFFIAFLGCFIVANWTNLTSKIKNNNPNYEFKRNKVIAISIIGGVISGLLGTGIDVILFAYLIGFSKLSPKDAIPTSVIIMALNAIAGFLFHTFHIGDFTADVAALWLAAFPIVIFGAPLGAHLASILNEKTTYTAIVVLCFVEFATTIAMVIS